MNGIKISVFNEKNNCKIDVRTDCFTIFVYKIKFDEFCLYNLSTNIDLVESNFKLTENISSKLSEGERDRLSFFLFFSLSLYLTQRFFFSQQSHF